MKKIIISIITFTIVIGIVALSINTAFGNQTITYIEKIKYDTGNTQFYYYHFTWWNYINNINLNTTDMSILVFDMPTRQWINNVQSINEIGNDMAVMVNYIIMILNAILYPFKVGAYLLRNVLALLGINQDTTNEYNGLAWLVVFVRDILGNAAIPYI